MDYCNSSVSVDTGRRFQISRPLFTGIIIFPLFILQIISIFTSFSKPVSINPPEKIPTRKAKQKYCICPIDSFPA